MDEVVAGIGPKIRTLRQQQGLSLQRLAARSGVSAASIHKIERSGMVPTIATLLKIAGALQSSVAYFVDEADEAEPVTFTSAGQGRTLLTSKTGLELRSISGPYQHFTVAGAMAVVAAGADSGPTPMEHPGEELVHLLEGTLELTVDGNRYELGAGDSLHFLTDRPHCWQNPGRQPARALWFAVRP
jgi:transcriptional regulator with XRE-family HTH domain